LERAIGYLFKISFLQQSGLNMNSRFYHFLSTKHFIGSSFLVMISFFPPSKGTKASEVGAGIVEQPRSPLKLRQS
jgi:hypothetical protein